MYILSSVWVSVHMYEAKRAMAGCSCSEKEQLNNLRFTNNLQSAKFPELVNSDELGFAVTWVWGKKSDGLHQDWPVRNHCWKKEGDNIWFLLYYL